MANESVEATIARYDERIKVIERMTIEAKTAAEFANRQTLDAVAKMERLAQFDPMQIKSLIRILEVFDDAMLKQMVRMGENFSEQTTDKREFDRSLRISVVTMIVSVVIFSVIVPLLQHFVLH